MFKRFAVTFLVLAFGIASALAAQAGALVAKVSAIDGSKVQVTVSGEAPKWLKKGAVVKIADESGKVIETAAKVSEISETTVTVIVKDGAGMKQGDAVSLQKGRAMSGC